jgi:hypothetical protein
MFKTYHQPCYPWLLEYRQEGVFIMEKRNNIRVPFHVLSVVKFEDYIIEGEVANLSTGGMLLKTDENLPLNEIVDISIFLYGSSSNLSLNMTGKIVRNTDEGIAIKFSELDLDSFIHLRNIVSRNALDDEKVMQEFKSFRKKVRAKE